jgi:predicted ATPase
VGPNGSGKSNFLDALAFVGRAVATTPEEALDERGGVAEILRRVPEHTDSFSIAIDFTVPWGGEPDQRANGSYEFEIGRPTLRRAPFEVVREECVQRRNSTVWEFRADRGQVHKESSGDVRAAWGDNPGTAIEADRLFITTAGAQFIFAPLFSSLRRMQFYSFDLDELRRPQGQSAGAVLGRRGEHLGDVLGALQEEARGKKKRLDAYLHAVVPGAVGIDRWPNGPYVLVRLRTLGGLGGREVVFAPGAMSDGTIRAAGVLAALFQPAVQDGSISLVGIEEPEIALHPAAAGVLFDALTEASERVQVVATTQSPDLLDRDDFDVSSVRAVTMQDGLTIIGEVDEASRQIVQKRLYTLGELMRANQLAPEPLHEDGPAPGST